MLLMPLNSAMAMKALPAGAKRGGKFGTRGLLSQRTEGLGHQGCVPP